MIVYLVTFTVSTFLYKVAAGVGRKPYRFVFYLLCIVLPAALAGLRDLSVGTDLSVYGAYVWKLAVASDSFPSLCSSTHDIEFVYLGLNYLVSRFTSDIHWFMFFHELLIMVIVVCTAVRFKNVFRSEFVLIFFFLYLYNISFNLLRQSIALVLVMFASSWIFYSQLKKSAIPFTAASFSHNSTFLAILLYPFKSFVEKYQTRKKMITVFFIVVGAIGYVFYAVIVGWLIRKGVYSSHYEAYVGQIGYKVHKIDLVLIFGMAAMLLLLLKHRERIEPFFSYSLFLLVVAFVINCYGGIVEIAVRIGHFFVMPLAFLLPLSAKPGRARQKLQWAVIVLLLGHLFYLAVITGMDGAIPYKSRLLGL